MYDWEKETIPIKIQNDLVVSSQSVSAAYKTEIGSWGRSTELCSPSNTGDGSYVYNFALYLDSNSIHQIAKDDLTIQGKIEPINLAYLYKPKFLQAYISPFKEVRWNFGGAGSVSNCVVNVEHL
jgi:hypothetical protein